MSLNKICILIVLIIICMLLTMYTTDNKNVTESEVENYSNEVFDRVNEGKNNDYWDNLAHNLEGTKKADDCYKLNQRDCLKYYNCGLCMKDGVKECIPGDEQGPLFKEDCQGWIYTNYYDKFIFRDKCTTKTRPWNTFYPEYEARYPSPISRATL